jgi:hypothetical protein
MPKLVCPSWANVGQRFSPKFLQSVSPVVADVWWRETSKVGLGQILGSITVTKGIENSRTVENSSCVDYLQPPQPDVAGV